MSQGVQKDDLKSTDRNGHNSAFNLPQKTKTHTQTWKEKQTSCIHHGWEALQHPLIFCERLQWSFPVTDKYTPVNVYNMTPKSAWHFTDIIQSGLCPLLFFFSSLAESSSTYSVLFPFPFFHQLHTSLLSSPCWFHIIYGMLNFFFCILINWGICKPQLAC